MEYYNETTQNKQNVTTRLRLKYIVLPAKSYNTYDKDNNETQPYPFENTEKSYLEREFISCSVRKIIEVLLLVFSSFFIWKRIELFIYFLHTTVVSTISKFIIRQEHIPGEECPSYAYDYEYHVLIVSTENDKDFITKNTIITRLENKLYKVYFPERDFDPRIPFLNSYFKALRIRNTLIVVVSKEFLEDPITFPIIYEISTMLSIKLKTINILVIKKDECEIPSLEICELFDTTQLFQTETCKTELCIWLVARIPLLNRTAIRVRLELFMLCHALIIFLFKLFLFLIYLNDFLDRHLRCMCGTVQGFSMIFKFLQ